jgi:hypothetical protein
MSNLIHWLEYLNGAKDQPPPHFPTRHAWWLLAIWWLFLLLLIAAFSGQSSRFIYIDF